METTSLTFGAPAWFWLLALVPLVAVLLVWSHRRSRELVSKLVAARLRDQLAGSVSPLRRFLRFGLMLLALAFAVVALAQPRWGFREMETRQKGRDVVIAIDTSRSMLATDVSPTRLARAKLFTQDLVRLMQGDRIGLVAFAGSAFLQAPLTLDYAAVTNALDELDTDVIPLGGTNIAAAITSAREAFGKAEGHIRALVILTDGEELDADGIAAAKKAQEEGIRIFTVGIGSAEGSLIPVRLDDGRPDFVRDEEGKPVTSRLDDSRLREIAAATGGFYVPLGPDAAKEVFVKGIEPMELAEVGSFSARQPIERFQWPLAAATIFLALSLLPGDRRRRIPVAVIMAFALQPAAFAQSGLDAYRNGNFDQAAQAFEKDLAAQPSSRALQFNAGAAAYKLGDYDKAAGLFTEALLSEDPKLREDASYNLANTLVRKGEAAAEPEAKKTNWENALEHYDEALRLDPENTAAKTNRDLVKKLLEELEKQQQQQQQQQQEQQQQNQPQDQQQQQDQQDQQGGEQENEKPQEQEQEQKKDQSDQSDSSDQSEQSDQKKDSQPQPTPTLGEKKEGELKSADGQSEPTPTPADSAEGQANPAEEEQEGRMSPSQARALLNALRNEEEKVNLMEIQQSPEEVRRDW